DLHRLHAGEDRRLGLVRSPSLRGLLLTLRLRRPLVPHGHPPPRARQKSQPEGTPPHPPAPAAARPSRPPSASGSSEVPVLVLGVDRLAHHVGRARAGEEVVV